MTLKLHPDLLAAGYEYLRQSTPFRGWGLPEADDIGFGVVKDTTMFADFMVVDGIPMIRVSERMHGHTTTLLQTIAHEIIHLHQHLKKLDTGGEHNADFWRRAKRVCAAHGFDPLNF